MFDIEEKQVSEAWAPKASGTWGQDFDPLSSVASLLKAPADKTVNPTWFPWFVFFLGISLMHSI